MSETYLIEVTPGIGSSRDIDEMRNAWLGEPEIWNALGQRHFGDKHTWGQRLWDLARDPTVPEFARAVLIMTFDEAYIVRANFARAASDIREFMKAYDVVGHWLEISDMLREENEWTGIAITNSLGDLPFRHHDGKPSWPNNPVEVYAYLEELSTET